MLAPPGGENLTELLASASPLDPAPTGLTDLLGAILASRPPWMADGLCAEHPELVWFPGQGDDIRPAKQTCAACLVKPECRSWALDQGDDLWGIWAGTTHKQRRQMRSSAVELRQRRPARLPRPRVPSRARLERRNRPTGTMEAVSRFLTSRPDEDLTAMAIDQAVTGGENTTRALAALVDEGYVTLTVGGVDARGRPNPRLRLHRHVRPFTATTDRSSAA